MNALELADAVEPLVLTSFHETQYIGRNAADMLRKQHEAIVQLREALAYASTYVQEDEAKRGGPCFAGQVIRQALKGTEHLK